MIFNFVERIFVYCLICVHASYAEFCRFNFVKKINDSVEFDCFVKEHQIKDMIWTKDNSTITKGEGDFSHLFYNTTTIYIPTIHREDEGLYSCFFLGQLIGRYCLRVEVPPEISIYVDSNHQQGVLWAKRGAFMNLKCVAVGAIPFVNITWSFKDITYISFGPTQTTVQDDDGSFTTNSSVSFMVTKNVNFIECISVGQNTSSQAASINISSYVVPSIHITLNGKNLTSPLRASTNTIYNFQCIAFGSKPTVKLGWKVDDTLQKERKTFQRPNEFNEYSYDSSINLTLHFSSSRTSISCFIESPPLPELDLSATLNILTDGQTGDEWKILLLVVLLVPIILGLPPVLWLKLKGCMHTQEKSFKKGGRPLPPVRTNGSVQCFKESVISNDEDTLYYSSVKYAAPERKLLDYSDICFLLETNISYVVSTWMGTINSPRNKKQSTLISTVEDKNHLQSIHWDKFVKKRLAVPDYEGILDCHGICFEKETLYILYEYFGTNTLTSYLRQFGEMTYGYDTDVQRDLVDYCMQIVNAMVFLERNGFAHPDLFSSKVLLTKQRVCKLYDFCLKEDAVQVISMMTRRDQRYSPCHAPETIVQKEYLMQTDVWYLATTMWEILSKGAELPQDQDYEETFLSRCPLPIPPVCPQPIYDMLLECWLHAPFDRPSIQEVYHRMARYSSTIQETVTSFEVHKTYSEKIYCSDRLSENSLSNTEQWTKDISDIATVEEKPAVYQTYFHLQDCDKLST